MSFDFSAIFDVLKNWVYTGFWAVEVALCRIVDWMQAIFRVASGQDEVSFDETGKHTNYLLNAILFNDSISNVYKMMAAIGFAFAFIFAIISVIRKSMDLDDKVKLTYGQILRNLLKSIVYIVGLNFGIAVVIGFSNTLLDVVTDAFDRAYDHPAVYFTNEQYAAMGRIYNTIGNHSMNPSYNSRYNINKCYNEIRGDLQYLDRTGMFEVYYETYEGEEDSDDRHLVDTWQSVIQEIATAADFYVEAPVDTYDEAIANSITKAMKLLKTNSSFYALDYYPPTKIKDKELHLGSMIFLLGTMGNGTTAGARNDKYNEKPDMMDDLRYPYYVGINKYYNRSQVLKDFDISLENTNYFIAYLVAVAIGYNLLIIVLSCLARIFNMVVLYLIAPPIFGLAPMDDGNRMQQWVQAFLIQAFSVFGSVISMRVFLIIVPIIMDPNLSFFNTGKADLYLNYIAKIAVIYAATVTIKKASALLTGILSGNGASASMQANDIAGDFGSALKTTAKAYAGGALVAATPFIAAKWGYNKLKGNSSDDNKDENNDERQSSNDNSSNDDAPKQESWRSSIEQARNNANNNTPDSVPAKRPSMGDIASQGASAAVTGGEGSGGASGGASGGGNPGGKGAGVQGIGGKGTGSKAGSGGAKGTKADSGGMNESGKNVPGRKRSSSAPNKPMIAGITGDKNIIEEALEAVGLKDPEDEAGQENGNEQQESTGAKKGSGAAQGEGKNQNKSMLRENDDSGVGSMLQDALGIGGGDSGRGNQSAGGEGSGSKKKSGGSGQNRQSSGSDSGNENAPRRRKKRSQSVVEQMYNAVAEPLGLPTTDEGEDGNDDTNESNATPPENRNKGKDQNTLRDVITGVAGTVGVAAGTAIGGVTAAVTGSDVSLPGQSGESGGDTSQNTNRSNDGQPQQRQQQPQKKSGGTGGKKQGGLGEGAQNSTGSAGAQGTMGVPRKRSGSVAKRQEMQDQSVLEQLEQMFGMEMDDDMDEGEENENQSTVPEMRGGFHGSPNSSGVRKSGSRQGNSSDTNSGQPAQRGLFGSQQSSATGNQQNRTSDSTAQSGSQTGGSNLQISGSNSGIGSSQTGGNNSGIGSPQTGRDTTDSGSTNSGSNMQIGGSTSSSGSVTQQASPRTMFTDTRNEGSSGDSSIFETADTGTFDGGDERGGGSIGSSSSFGGGSSMGGGGSFSSGGSSFGSGGSSMGGSSMQFSSGSTSSSGSVTQQASPRTMFTDTRNEGSSGDSSIFETADTGTFDGGDERGGGSIGSSSSFGGGSSMGNTRVQFSGGSSGSTAKPIMNEQGRSVMEALERAMQSVYDPGVDRNTTQQTTTGVTPPRPRPNVTTTGSTGSTSPQDSTTQERQSSFTQGLQSSITQEPQKATNPSNQNLSSMRGLYSQQDDQNTDPGSGSDE
ncbi:MAG: hypothetical protein IJ595_07780 [Oscillospiraceae bacterium]|nr:hypothetical protein [Oscillospiraceae bacterium]